MLPWTATNQAVLAAGNKDGNYSSLKNRALRGSAWQPPVAPLRPRLVGVGLFQARRFASGKPPEENPQVAPSAFSRHSLYLATTTWLLFLINCIFIYFHL
jgi:hypothetical protein